MKAVLACMLLAAVVMTVYGQRCSTTQFCRNNTMTTCGNNAMEICDRFHGHVCHCVQQHSSGQTCNMKEDCPSCDHNRKRHCYDGHCLCSVI